MAAKVTTVDIQKHGVSVHRLSKSYPFTFAITRRPRAKHIDLTFMGGGPTVRLTKGDTKLLICTLQTAFKPFKGKVKAVYDL